jgi:hypothetical protein
VENFLGQLRICERVFRAFFGCPVVYFGGLCSSMAVVQSGNCLCQHLPDEIFSDVVLGLTASADELLQVSTIAMLHNYENLCLRFIDKPVVIFYDV